jgi:hypothetical protein
MMNVPVTAYVSVRFKPNFKANAGPKAAHTMTAFHHMLPPRALEASTLSTALWEDLVVLCLLFIVVDR